ncbi:hypothetical protein TNCT_340681 [Trichonephila clavata]|uniref:RING-type domain-containing protein n=1 Tax=Trichonephila clavata TaxID=2740835 RepID=A0A8X6LA06_TRICU|nr:hypothetical protein TNCT_340681 [Trichonephila clavata]
MIQSLNLNLSRCITRHSKFFGSPHLADNFYHTDYSFRVLVNLVDFTGRCLKPKPGTYSKKDDLIFTLHNFYEKYYRPSQVAQTKVDLKYQINPQTDEFMKRALHGGQFCKSDCLFHKQRSKMTHSNNEAEMNCSICLSCDDDSELYTLILCKHTFNSKCLQQWVENKKDTCPYCRGKIRKRNKTRIGCGPSGFAFSVLQDIIGSDEEAVISDTDSESNSDSDGYLYSDSESNSDSGGYLYSDSLSESHSDDDLIFESHSDDDLIFESHHRNNALAELL